MSDDLKMERTDMKIEGDRNLHSYTFKDSAGNVLTPEPTLPMPKPSPADSLQPKPADDQHGNLTPEGVQRKG